MRIRARASSGSATPERSIRPSRSVQASVTVPRWQAALRPKEGSQGQLHLRRQPRCGCLAEYAWDFAVRRDEGDTAWTPRNVPFQSGSHVGRNGSFEVVHQQLDSGRADDLVHGCSSTRWARYPRNINRARWTRCRAAAGSMPSASATSAVGISSRSRSTKASR